MTEATPHPRDGDAAEYVLGTLPWLEREAFERELAADASLRAAVLEWEQRLAPLADGIAPTPPSPALWRSIVAAIGGAATVGSAGANVVGFAGAAELARLKRSRTVWRGVSAAASALAAGLALFFATDRVPGGPPGQEGGLVAVVNRSGELPALIVRVDPRAGTVQVRSLAAESPADRSLELWSIVGSNPPRSLGLVAPGIARVSVAETDRPRLDGATIAVTVEQPGGSPDGRPHGPVVYSGKLVPENP